MNELLVAVETSTLAVALKASRNIYPFVNALHIIAIGALFGAILALDLRLLGLARSVPARPLALYLPRVAGCGLALAVLSGALMFSVQPFDYVGNRAFLLKIALVGVGALHALSVHASASWKRLAFAEGGSDRRLKISAALSLVIWIAAIFSGRFIAF